MGLGEAKSTANRTRNCCPQNVQSYNRNTSMNDFLKFEFEYQYHLDHMLNAKVIRALGVQLSLPVQNWYGA